MHPAFRDSCFRWKQFVFSHFFDIFEWVFRGKTPHALVLWAQAAKIHLDKILELQKRVIRLIHIREYTSNAIFYFSSSNILSVEVLYFKTVSILMYDVHNSQVPPSISNLFAYTQDIHDYNTRFSSNVNFYVKHSCSNKLKTSFSRIAAKIWNGIPCDLRNYPKNKFKRKLLVLLSIFTRGIMLHE